MGLGILRSIVRPLTRIATSRPPCPVTSTSAKLGFHVPSTQAPWSFQIGNHFHSLTDTRFPKRRPRPYAWVQYTPGDPILPNQPNEGSIYSGSYAEKKKRKAQLQEAKKKKKLSYDQSSDIDSKPVLSFGNLVHIHRQKN
ncbi:hypothetical protein SDJN02_21334, partial [Cucurbita argyrosperma subsp. argyrosperma]